MMAKIDELREKLAELDESIERGRELQKAGYDCGYIIAATQDHPRQGGKGRVGGGRSVILHGDCLNILRTMPNNVVDCCVTSPPYWGLRDYGHDDQIGLEETPEEYVSKMVAVFHEVKRVLKPEGTLWLNLGDSYSGSGNLRNPDGTRFTCRHWDSKTRTSAGTVMGGQCFQWKCTTRD